MPTNNHHTHNGKQPEFRLFLSSTFKDLQPEREQLVKKVFPQIRALCRERGVDFTEIDLRWGITDEEARSGKIVRICLEEIDKCRPYFLGILGSRYGWRPQISDIESDGELLNIYPWLRKFVAENKSIVELEFTYGALQSEDEGSAFFYEQNCDDRISEEDRIPYNRLKKTLRDSGLLDHRFNTPEELGEKVLRDLTAVLDRDFPVKKEQTPAERERNAHEAFARNRTHSYIANPEYYERFEEFVDGRLSMVDSQEDFLRQSTIDHRPSTPMILWGKSGFGKSALMAHLTSEYGHRHPNDFIIRHFVGATSGGSSSDDVIRHLMLEVKEHYQLSDELPQSNVQDELPIWLAKIPEGEKLILAIDAVNQLTGIGNEMHWLPEFIPANVRLIISTTPELPLDQLRKRNWQELEILPLTPNQRIRITQEFLARYHKHLHPDQLEIIASEPKLESPLFLRTVLEELRIFGQHSALDMHLATYLASENEAELFQTVLARMERDHGKDIVRNIMSAIWASHYGLSETELMEICGLSRLTLSEFLIALEFHLMQRTGLFTFFHNYLRDAVATRYLHDDTARKEMHRHIASYFSEEPYDERRRNEEPWQWQQAEDSEKFKQCITDIPMLEMLLDESRLQELIGYWVELQKHSDLAETYHSVMSEYKEKSTDEPHFAELSGKLGNALVSASHYKEAEHHLRTALELEKRLHGEEGLETAYAMNNLTEVYRHTGNFHEAEMLLQKAIAIKEAHLGKNDPSTAKSVNDLGVIVYSQGNLDEAIKCYQNALSMYESYYKRNHPEIADTLCNIGTILFYQKKYVEAITFFERSITIYEQIYGSSHNSLIAPLSNLAMAYMEIRDFEKAEPRFFKTLALTKAIYGNMHELLRGTFLNLGVFYSRKKDFTKAIDTHKDALEIGKKLYGEDHYLTINSYLSIGILNYRIGEVDAGRQLVERYLPLQKEKLGANHQMYKNQENAWNELSKG